MDMLFSEDIWSMETVPSPPHKLRVVELENEMLTHNNIFPPIPPDEDEDDYVLLSLTPWTKLEAPTRLAVTKQEELHDFDLYNFGQFTVYELANFETSNEQVILYVNCNPMCPVLKSGSCSTDGENSTMDCVIVSCPPLKKVSNEEMIFAPDYSDFDNKKLNLISDHDYYNKEKRGTEAGIGSTEKSLGKNDVIKEVEITSSSFVNKALDCKSEDNSKRFKIPVVPKRRKSVLQPRNIIESSISNKTDHKPLPKTPNKKPRGKVAKVGILQHSAHSALNISESDSNSNLEQPRKVNDAKPITVKRAIRKVGIPSRENNVNSYPEKNNNSFPVMHQDFNDDLLNVKEDTFINELPIEDVISVTVSGLESEEKNETKENVSCPYLETCLTDQINVKRIIDSVASELSVNDLMEQNNTDLSQTKYRCRNICCNRHFRKAECRTRHEKQCLKNSFVQWRDDEMFNKTKTLQTLEIME